MNSLTSRGLAAMLVLGLAVVWWLGAGRQPSEDVFQPVDEHQDHAPTRLVSLSPAITETIAALGAPELLVGRSAWCTLPTSITTLPTVGSTLTPDLEAIARLQPTRILMDASEGARHEHLRALAPLEVLPWLTVEDVARSTRRLGAIVDRYVAAETLASRYEEALGATPPKEGPSVLMVLAGSGLDAGEIWYVKRNSLHGAVLHAAGARNAIDRDVAGPPMLSLESLISLDPETVLLMASGDVGPERAEAIRAEWERLTPLQAVREDRILVVTGSDLLSPGPTILRTVDRVRQALDTLEGRE